VSLVFALFYMLIFSQPVKLQVANGPGFESLWASFEYPQVNIGEYAGQGGVEN
jgi:hypothetical protein